MIARRHWPYLYLAGALLAGVSIGAAWPPPPLPKASEQGNAWSLPAMADIARHVPQDLAVVTSGMRWKGDVGGTPGERAAWRLAGTVDEATPAILVMTPDSPDKVKRIELGQALPDGSVLHKVDGDRAMTKRDACIVTYQLFQSEAVDMSEGCEEPEAPDQGIRK
ncbi:hypothetical protein SQW19_02440 [Stenotrophomonas acidaminiphila]|uniref:Uncharacterized protein n=1 Tax=Stenotrophomonas acidaminiphila TaxID=128780 RepID=A0A0S1AW72_9GAMM|nr:hypothetical protein [Stenotrophomonas acidaminiphila]ALJ27049.1 hypothetical protein AOT14_06100 [Stenotrophomonas acidaminiphila]AUZ54177.1 hypothetical protein B1L07_02455 [Stenotrophomonas acidaminiphila]WPU56485.1 hypothetical protein SQW19_02440 [Stenotrophomonas acidaminiphila]